MRTTHNLGVLFASALMVVGTSGAVKEVVCWTNSTRTDLVHLFTAALLGQASFRQVRLGAGRASISAQKGFRGTNTAVY